ncbi:MAG: LysR family transcriptional regulator, partial [Sphingomonas sp.]
AANLSQPALSQALASLERQFSLPLFERTPRGVALTPVGRATLSRIDRALAHFAAAFRRLTVTPQRQEPQNYLVSSHVRGLIYLAEAGNFTRAAAAARISIPSLHRAVRDLEQLAGCTLIERRGRGVGLTKAGVRLADGFMLGARELRIALDETREGGGRLSIGAMALSRSLLLPAALAALHEEYPDAAIDVVEGSYLELVEMLRSGRLDVIVGALREKPVRDLKQEALFTDRLTIIGRADHPLAGIEASFEQLAAFPWIVARRASALLERWQQLFDFAGATRPRAPIHCGSVALIRGILVRSDFLTLLSRDQVSAEIEAGSLIQIRSHLPDTMRRIGMVSRSDWHATRLQRRFFELLHKQAAGRSASSA